MHPGELQSSHAELATSPALQLDAAPRSYKIFSFIDTSQNNKKDSVKNPFQGNVEGVGNAEGVGNTIGEGSAQARKL